MSPHIRTMLEDAADDGGRPVTLDLAAVRAAGRRATWRQRSLVGGGAFGAAAVITSIALVLAPGGSSGFQPSDDPSDEPQPTAYGEEVPALDGVLLAFESVLEAHGYDVVPSPTSVAIGLSDAAEGEEGSESSETSLAAGTMAVIDGESTGAAILADFSDVSAVNDMVLGEADPPLSGDEVDGYDYTDQCAVFPANVHRADFAWDTCDESDDGATRIATGGDSYGDALGVTLIRPDGSGVSLALSTAAYDRPTDGGAPTKPPLTELPLDADQLLAVSQDTLAAGPFFPPPPDVSIPPSADPCGEATPPDTACGSTGFDDIDTQPLADALGALGIEAVETGGYGGGGDGGGTGTVIQLMLTDGTGRVGSASIGIYSDLSAAQHLSIGEDVGESAGWCAVAPVEVTGYQWTIADDPSLACADFYFEASNPLVVVHDESDADAIGATLILADGSVVSVSVSQAVPTTISALPTPLAEVPLDQAGIVDVLQRLAAAK